jgi:hypothetical protein
MSRPFRILSLDGGGIMGAFAASTLATFERETGRRIVDHFDLIAGTSTGGIIAIALAMGQTAEQVCRFYENDGPQIFPSGGFSGQARTLRAFFRPKFDPSALHRAIARVVSDRPMGEARTRLVIPSYDVNTGKIVVFKTHPPTLPHRQISALDVALATSAAPTYFPAHTIAGRGTFIDGGLWANCPTMVGLVEAFDFLGQGPESVRMLSVSTTNYPFRLDDPSKLRGVKDWLPQLVDTFMFGQAQAAVNMASCLLRRGLFHRIDYQVPPKAFQMDNARCVAELIGMGRQIAELNENLGVVRESFLNGEAAEPYQPLPVDEDPRAGTRSGHRP